MLDTFLNIIAPVLGFLLGLLICLGDAEQRLNDKSKSHNGINNGAPLLPPNLY